ncbi:MAG: PAS domain-containing protein [Calditrichia bacterium]
MSLPSLSPEAKLQIAMGIGNSTELDVLLSESLNAYLQQCGAVAGEVYFNKKSESQEFEFKRVYGFHRLGKKQALYDDSDLLNLPKNIDENELSQFLATLPRVVEDPEGDFANLMALPDVGLLMLITPNEPMSEKVMRDLVPFNHKLADACLSCLQIRHHQKKNEQLKRHNKKLQSRNHELKKARERFIGIIDNFQQLTKSLRDWDKQFRKLYGEVQDIAFQVSTDGILQYISPAISNYTDYSANEIQGKLISELFFDIKEYHQLRADLKTRGQALNFEAHLKNKNKNMIYVNLNASAIYNARGDIESVEGAILDIFEWEITADEVNLAVFELERNFQKKEITPEIFQKEKAYRMHAETAMRKISRLNADLIAMIPQMLIGVDENDCITHWNEAAERVTSISHKKVIGQPLLRCGIRWNWDKLVKTISTCIEEERPIRLKHFNFTRPDDQNGWLDLSVRPIFDDKDKPSGIIILGSEIAD